MKYPKQTEYIGSPLDFSKLKEVYIQQLNLWSIVLFTTYHNRNWIDSNAVAVFKVKPKEKEIQP